MARHPPQPLATEEKNPVLSRLQFDIADPILAFIQFELSGYLFDRFLADSLSSPVGADGQIGDHVFVV